MKPSLQPKLTNIFLFKAARLEQAYAEYWKVQQAYRITGAMSFSEASRTLNKVLACPFVKGNFRKKVKALQDALILGKQPKKKVIKITKDESRVVSLCK